MQTQCIPLWLLAHNLVGQTVSVRHLCPPDPSACCSQSVMDTSPGSLGTQWVLHDTGQKVIKEKHSETADRFPNSSYITGFHYFEQALFVFEPSKALYECFTGSEMTFLIPFPGILLFPSIYRSKFMTTLNTPPLSPQTSLCFPGLCPSPYTLC